MDQKKGKIYIGTSGFSYQDWGKSVFYPSSLPSSDWLKYYSSHFNTVELTVTFNKLPHKEFFIQWQKEVPAFFRFSVIGNQYITHIKKLTAIAEPLKLFFDRVSKLKENLKNVVWEIPSLGRSNHKKLEGFMKHLKKYSSVDHIFDLEGDVLSQETIELIKENRIFLIEKEEFKEEKSIFENQSFRYLKLNGPEKSLKKALYSKEFLKKLAEKIQQFSSDGIETYIYFGNDTKGYAIQNAKELIQLTSY